MRTLPDYLRRGMKLIVVGCNPADRWARAGHYYAGRTNPFWPLLYDSGILPESLPYTDDKRLIEFGIGLTDLVKRATRNTGDLDRQEIAEGRILLAQKLEEYAPPACPGTSRLAGLTPSERTMAASCLAGVSQSLWIPLPHRSCGNRAVMLSPR
jgi:G:T/U-mismatch repair DNA glycosylase